MISVEVIWLPQCRMGVERQPLNITTVTSVFWTSRDWKGNTCAQVLGYQHMLGNSEKGFRCNEWLLICLLHREIQKYALWSCLGADVTMHGNPSLQKLTRNTLLKLRRSASVSRQRASGRAVQKVSELCGGSCLRQSRAPYWKCWDTVPGDVSDKPTGCIFGVEEIGLGGCWIDVKKSVYYIEKWLLHRKVPIT
jgi:hypothetical protein